MSHPFALLELQPDADERAIKRAYARKLKQTRPDEDPVGFQQLHEAYQYALAYHAHHAMALAEGDEEDDEQTAPAPAHAAEVMAEVMAITAARDAEVQIVVDVDDTPARPQYVALNGGHEPAEPAILIEGDAPSPTPSAAHLELPVNAEPEERVDDDALAREILERAGRDGPATLAQYLDRHPALYSLSTKRRMGQEVFQRIANGAALTRLDTLAALGDFFGIQPPPWLEHQLRVRLAVASDDTAAFGEPRKAVIRQLKRPFRWPIALMVSCLPGMSARIGLLASHLRANYGEDVPGVNPEQVAFFRTLANPIYFGAWRWAGVALLSVLAALLIGGLAAMTDATPARIVQVAGYAALATVVTLVLIHGARALWYLQTLPSSVRARGFTGLVLGICVVALWMDTFSAWDESIQLPAFVILAGATIVYLQRAFAFLRFGAGIAFAAAWIPEGWLAPSTPMIFMAGGTVAMTLFDLLYARRKEVTMGQAVNNRWTQVASFVVLAVGAIAAAAKPLIPLLMFNASSDFG